MDRVFQLAVDGDWDTLLMVLEENRQLACEADVSGMTLLHWVCLHQMVPTEVLVKIVLANPRSVHTRNATGHLPIDLAMEARCDQRVIEVLRAAEAHQNQQQQQQQQLQQQQQQLQHQQQQQRRPNVASDAGTDEMLMQQQHQQQQQQADLQHPLHPRFLPRTQSQLSQTNSQASQTHSQVSQSHSQASHASSSRAQLDLQQQMMVLRKDSRDFFDDNEYDAANQQLQRMPPPPQQAMTPFDAQTKLAQDRALDRQQQLDEIRQQMMRAQSAPDFGADPEEEDIPSDAEELARATMHGDGWRSKAARNTFPPRWKQARSCNVCKRQFSLTKRRHHCRNCGNSVCAQHSHQRVTLPKFELYDPQRVCDRCFLSGRHLGQGGGLTTAASIDVGRFPMPNQSNNPSQSLALPQVDSDDDEDPAPRGGRRGFD